MIKDYFDFIDSKRVMDSKNLAKKYTANTIGAETPIFGAIIVKTRDEIKKILSVANTKGLSIYPISTGKNWGYGSANPPCENAIILDLSELKDIRHYDDEVGSITVEPGVTQQDLYDFLVKHGSKHMVPTTGAGPSASILANACERGYGITPDTDHFNAIYEMEVILPSGETIFTGFTNYNSELLRGVFKTPPGASLNGLFTQSALGIIVSMTIRLEKKPENISIFTFKIKGDKKLQKTIEVMRDFRQDMGSLVGGVNFMNKERTDAMKNLAYKGAFEGKDEFEWQVFGGFYGTHETVKAAKKELRSRIRKNKIALNAIILGPGNIGLVRWLHKLCSLSKWLEAPKMFLQQGIKGYEVLTGKPNQVALPLAYIGINKIPDENTPLNPATDGCGLFWFAPLFPCKAAIVQKFTDGVKEICVKHNVIPLITLTTVNHSCIDSTIPILFDPKNKASFENAKACYEELMDFSRSIGILPYRLSSTKMSEFFKGNKDTSLVKFIGELKKRYR